MILTRKNAIKHYFTLILSSITMKGIKFLIFFIKMKTGKKNLSKMQQYVAPAMEVLDVEVSADILAGSETTGTTGSSEGGSVVGPGAKQWSGNSIFDEVEISED